MNITVYLGSREGNRPSFRRAAQALGAWIGQGKHTLIYGGSRLGLMGVLADAVLTGGGRVIGVEPEFFVEKEVQHPTIHQLIVTETMAERKQRMISLGDAFVAFPGGIGTLEEIVEVMVLAKLGRLEKPFCLLNLDGYYEPFRDCLLHMAAEGFLEEDWVRRLHFPDTVGALAEQIASGPTPRG